MNAVSNAIFDRLMSSDALKAYLATYPPNNGNGSKAVFTTVPIPPGVLPPFIVIPPPQVDINGEFDTKTSAGRGWTRDIAVYQRATGDDSTVDAMGELIHDLFHKQHANIDITGFGTMICTATGPVVAPTDETMYGRVVTVTLSAIR